MSNKKNPVPDHLRFTFQIRPSAAKEHNAALFRAALRGTIAATRGLEIVSSWNGERLYLASPSTGSDVVIDAGDDEGVAAEKVGSFLTTVVLETIRSDPRGAAEAATDGGEYDEVRDDVHMFLAGPVEDVVEDLIEGAAARHARDLRKNAPALAGLLGLAP